MFSTTMFSERVVVGPQKSFSHSDLMEYVESLLKEAKEQEARRLERSNYGWLRTRSLPLTTDELDDLKPIVQKLTSESCSVIAVKLDTLTEDVKPPHVILTAFKSLLEQQYNIQLIDGGVKRAKESKRGKNRRNKVHPELLPPGRQPTVSFILNDF